MSDPNETKSKSWHSASFAPGDSVAVMSRDGKSRSKGVISKSYVSRNSNPKYDVKMNDGTSMLKVNEKYIILIKKGY